VVVVCAKPEFEDEHFDTLANPSLIVEVLSKSTEAFDRGSKFARYRTIPSLSDYLLISQEAIRLERFTRQQSGHWLWSESVHLEDSVELDAIGCSLALRDVYDRIAELTEQLRR
ncbi:MAG: Uma2 family endonuclease, partial [Acidobacteriota bacterium]